MRKDLKMKAGESVEDYMTRARKIRERQPGESEKDYQARLEGYFESTDNDPGITGGRLPE